MERAAEQSESMSIDAYLEFEMASAGKHEYVDGRVYSMTGASSPHARIAMNVGGHLWMAGRSSGCRTYMSDMKLRTPDERVYYPDVMLVCTPRDHDGSVVDDPCVVVEVASPSTWRVDRFEKQPAYVMIPSLTTFLLVDQHGRRVDHWRRTETGVWQHDVIVQRGEVPVPCANVTLTLDEIYEGIAMPSAPVQRVYEAEPAYDAYG